MATFKFEGIDKYQKQLSELGRHTDGIIKYAVYDAAGMVCDAIKDNCPESGDKRTQGDLKRSIGLSDFKNDDGYIYTQVMFSGYDRKGTPLDLVARVLESGKSTKRKHAFIRPAVDKVKRAAEFAIEKALDEKIKQYMK